MRDTKNSSEWSKERKQTKAFGRCFSFLFELLFQIYHQQGWQMKERHMKVTRNKSIDFSSTQNKNNKKFTTNPN